MCQLQQAVKIFDHRGVALSGPYLVYCILCLVQVAGCQCGKEQRFTNLRHCWCQLQRMLQVAHRRIRLAHSHTGACQTRLQSYVVGCQTLCFLERIDCIVAATRRRIGTAQQVVSPCVGVPRLDHLGQGIGSEIRPTLGELELRLHLVGSEIIRYAGYISPYRFLCLCGLSKLLLDDGLQEVPAWNAPDIGIDFVQRRIGGLVVLGLDLEHGLQINRLHVPGRRLHYGVEIGLGLVRLICGNEQTGAINQRLDIARLIRQRLIEHGERACHVSLRPQNFGLCQQRLS